MKIGAPMRVQYALDLLEKNQFLDRAGQRWIGAHVADVLEIMGSEDKYVAEVEKWIAALPSHDPAVVGACVRACIVMHGERHFNEFVRALVLRTITVPDDYEKTELYRTKPAPVRYVKGRKSLLVSDDHLRALNQLLSHYHGQGDRPNTMEHALIGEVWVYVKEAIK